MTIRSSLIAVCLASVAVSAAAWVIAQEALPAADPLSGAPPTDARHYSYAIGRQIGESFREQKPPADWQHVELAHASRALLAVAGRRRS